MAAPIVGTAIEVFSTTSGTAGDNTHALTVPSGNDGLIIWLFYENGNVDPTSMSYDGDAMTLIGSSSNDAASFYETVAAYSLANPTTGSSANVTFNWTGGSDAIMVAVPIQDMGDIGTPVSENYSAAGDLALDITHGDNALLMGGAIVNRSDGTVTATSPTNETYAGDPTTGSSGFSCIVGDRTVASAATSTLDIDTTAYHPRASLGFEIEEASGGGGVSGTAVITLSGLAVSGVGTYQDQFSGTATITLPSVQLDASLTYTPPDINGTAVFTLPAFVIAATGTFAGSVSGTSAITLPMLEVAASLTVVNPGFNGSGQITLPAFEVSATGTYEQAEFTGTAAITLPSLQLDASGTYAPNIFNGTAAIILPSIQVAATLTNPDGLDDADFTNQGIRQLNARNFTGSTETYEGDYNTVAIDLGPYVGTYNERLLQFLNDQMGSSHTALPQAQLAFAASVGVSNWDAVRSFTIS